MTARRVLLRCDAGSTEGIGTGHLARCMLVADAIRPRGAEVSFCGRFTGDLERRIGDRYRLIPATTGEPEPDLLARGVELARPHVLVLDRLDTLQEEIKAVRESVPVIITLDDEGDGAALADIVVNAVTGGGDSCYATFEYLAVRPPEPAPAGSRDRARVVLSFGGYDHRRLGEQVIAALNDEIDAEILWLVRKGDAASGSRSDRVLRVEDAPDFSALLASADVAVVAGGLTLFDALANGVPCVALPQYEHQARTIDRLADRGALVPVDGDPAQLGQAAVDALTRLLEDPKLREDLHRRGIELLDAGGLHRFADLVTVVEPLEWDSEYFGVPIARIHPLRLTERILEFAQSECDRLGIACAYYLSDCHDAQSVHLAEREGFTLVDIRLTFERQVDEETASEDPTVRDAAESDQLALADVARQAYVHTRYFFDPRFPRDRCEDFYVDWLAKCVRGELGTRVFVIEDDQGPQGYVCVNHETAATASILLAGVSEQGRGKGIGQRLVRHALWWAGSEDYRRLRVVTQGRNYAAQRLYQRCGFLTSKTELWYHRWFT